MRRKLKIDNSRIIILLIHNETILFIRKNLPRKSPIQFKLFTFWKFQIQKLQFQTFFENSNWPRSRIFWMGHFYLVQGHTSLQMTNGASEPYLKVSHLESNAFDFTWNIPNDDSRFHFEKHVKYSLWNAQWVI